MLVGLVVGLGLENKQSRAAPARRALACGCLLDRRFGLARSRWLWAGAALASSSGCRTSSGRRTTAGRSSSSPTRSARRTRSATGCQLLPLQLLLIGPLLAPLWLAGLWWLLRRTEARPYRPLGLAYLTLLVVVFVAGAKPYYTMGLLLALLGAGAVVAERRLAAGKTTRLRLGVVIGVSAAVAAAITLPLVPVGDLHATPIPAINEDAIETVGWPALTATVASRVEPAPAGRARPTRSCSRATTARRVRSPASALALGIRRAYSGHNAFWRFGRPPDGAGPIIVVGYRSLRALQGSFTGCRLAARIDNGVALDNEEQGGPVWLCAATVEPWSTLWPRLRHLDP